MAKALIGMTNDAMVLESCLTVPPVEYGPISPVLNIY